MRVELRKVSAWHHAVAWRRRLHAGGGGGQATVGSAQTYLMAMPSRAYMVDVELGLPPRQVVGVELDTGSSLLAVPAVDCVNCAAGGQRYDSSASPGGTAVPCEASDMCDPHAHLDSPQCQMPAGGPPPPPPPIHSLSVPWLLGRRRPHVL